MNKEKGVVIDLDGWKKWKVQKEQELKRRQNVYVLPIIKRETRNCPKCDEPVRGEKCRNCGFPLAISQINIDSFLKNE